MFHQLMQSADKGRLEFVETQIDDQSTPIGLDGKKQFHRLPQADSSKQVHTRDDGIKSSSKEIVQEHIEDNLEDGCSIKATPKTSSTGGQQRNSMTDACKTKENKGHDKHKGKNRKSLSHTYWKNIRR